MTLRVPYIADEAIERDAEALLAQYAYAKGAEIRAPIPIEDIVEKHLKLRVEFDEEPFWIEVVAIDEGRSQGIDLDAFGDDDLEVPPRPDPALTLADLRSILETARLLPKGVEATHLGESDYRYLNGHLPEAICVTIDPEFFEKHAESVEFWTPGSPAFPDLEVYQRLAEASDVFLLDSGGAADADRTHRVDLAIGRADAACDDLDAPAACDPSVLRLH